MGKNVKESLIEKTTETRRVSRRIFYYYSDGSKVIDDKGRPAVANQWADFVREVTLDKKSGKTSYGSWSTVTFPEVPVINVKGFIPSISVIPEFKDVSPANPPENVDVFFTSTADIDDRKSFVDVNKSMQFYPAVMWAAEKGIATGTKGFFDPDASTTLEHVISFIWRSEGSPSPSSKEYPFKMNVDSKRYSYDAIVWCAEKGIIDGGKKEITLFAACKKKDIVEMLWRLSGKPVVEKKNFSFKNMDGSSDSYRALQWAFYNKILTGNDKDFVPDEVCKRGEAVDILYHYNLLKNRKNR